MTDFPLWDDNPAEVDLLGFDAVVAPVVQAVAADSLDPVTIGIHGPWGSGKSTVLRLIEDAIPSDSKYLVVRTDPWEYDDHADVKGTVIAEVLAALEKAYGETAGIGTKTKNLLKRISWSRAAIALASGAVTMQWDPDKVVEAFTPKTKEAPDSMTGFRDEFAELLDDLDLDRVVVLVDDLDRCLPGAVTATFEAIKLFLSVPKMVFIIAADQDMVRDAIAVSVDSTSRGDRFAARYLDKIIQLPVSLPRLAPHEAEAYTALLLARSENPDANQFSELVAHCRERRRSNAVPLVGDLGSLSWRPSDITLSLAAQLAQGMGADKVSNPREVKRFLNAFAVRQSIAKARSIEVAPAVIAKLLLLEDRYRDDFDQLVATPAVERAALLARWEAWAIGGEDAPERPETISEGTQVWAASEPALAEVELGPYITLAGTLASSWFGTDLSDELTALVARMLGTSAADRGLALETVLKRPVADRRLVVTAILHRARSLTEISEVIEALVGLAKETPELAADIAQGIQEECWRKLEPASVAALSASDVAELVTLVGLLAHDPDVEADVRTAAQQLEQA